MRHQSNLRFLAALLVGLSLAAAVLFSVSQRPLIPPASIDEIARTVLTLQNKGMTIGTGILVGRCSPEGERIFFLTARHVVTYQTTNVTQFALADGTNTIMTLDAKPSRWLTPWMRFDAAWTELTADEKAELAAKGRLSFLSLDRRMTTAEASCHALVGTWAEDLDTLLLEEKRTISSCLLFFGKERENGSLSGRGTLELPYPHNTNLKACQIEAYAVTSARVSKPGDSGGPAFVRLSHNGGTYWALAGLVLGKSNDGTCSALMPLDAFRNTLPTTTNRLVDHPGYW